MTSKLSRADFDALTGTSILFITAKWCSFSKETPRHIDNIDLKLVRDIINLDIDENKELCEHLNIRCTPTLIAVQDKKSSSPVSGNDKIEVITKDIKTYLKSVK